MRDMISNDEKKQLTTEREWLFIHDCDVLYKKRVRFHMARILVDETLNVYLSSFSSIRLLRFTLKRENKSDQNRSVRESLFFGRSHAYRGYECAYELPSEKVLIRYRCGVL
jgi:hypothetical protein